MAFFNADSYQEVSIDYNGNTKYDNHGGGKQCYHPRIMGRGALIGLVAHIEHKLDLRPDEITEKE